MTAVFGLAWTAAFNPVITECTSGEANRLYGDQVGFLVYTFENQLCRAGQIITEAWTKSMAEFYKVKSLGETSNVVALIVRIIGEADLSPAAFLSWSVRQSTSSKSKNNLKPVDSKTVAREKQQKAASSTTIDVDPTTKKRKKLSSKERRAAKAARGEPATPPTVKEPPKAPTERKVTFGDPPRQQRICFNNVLYQLGVEGHGHVHCTRPNCSNVHELDRTRKADYVSLASSPAFNVPADVRLICETAARAL
jgi:hypothetical protein